MADRQALVFDDFPPEADLLQRRMSLGLKPLAEEIWRSGDFTDWGPSQQDGGQAGLKTEKQKTGKEKEQQATLRVK
jgi:hypothetical protein